MMSLKRKSTNAPSPLLSQDFHTPDLSRAKRRQSGHPSELNARSRHPQFSPDDEAKQEEQEDDIEEEEPSPLTQSQRSNKRRSTNGPHSSLPASDRRNDKGKRLTLSQRADTVDPSEEDDVADIQHPAQRSLTNGSAVLRRDVDGFLPGSIVRVSLKNFVTYEDVQFFPCPHLNMIIGPNGTGKSSLVCAIALGLGFSPTVLERAPELKMYIKTGSTEGFVEIELKGKPGKKNDVFKLRIIEANNTRVFELNGERTTVNKIQDRVRSYNVQVDNLCCFLPQEKVSKFADMKEPELLSETQKVAGHPKLHEWHSQLIAEGKEKISSETQLATVRKTYEDVKKQVDNMQRDVDRLETRQRIEDNIRVYEFALRSAQYHVMVEEHRAAKAEAHAENARVQELEQANAPMNEQQQILNKLYGQYQACRTKIVSATTRHESSMKTIQDTLTDATKKVEAACERLTSIKEDERRRKELKVKLTRELELLAEKISQPVEEADLTRFNAQLKSTSARMREIYDQISDLKTRQVENYDDLSRIRDRQSKIERDIANLQSVSARKLNDMDKYVPKLNKAFQVMQRFQHENRFRGKVFEPIRLVISPKDPRFATAIENCISQDLLNTIIFTDPHDYELMAHECNDKQKLRVNLSCLAPGEALANHPHALPSSEIREMGFDGFVIDLLNGPDEVLAFLCQHARLNSIPVAHAEGAKVNSTRMQDRKFPIKSYIVGPTRFTISFSAYGSRAMSLKSYGMKPARILSIASVDEHAVRAKKAEQDGLTADANKNQAAAARLKDEETQLRAEHEEAQNRKVMLEGARKEASKARIEYLKNVATHESKTKQLQQECAKPTFDQERQKRRAELKVYAKEHAAVVAEFKNHHCQISQLNTALCTLAMRVLQHEADQKAFEQLCQSKNVALQEAREAYKEAHRRSRDLLHQGKIAHSALQNDLEANPEIRGIFLAFKAEHEVDNKKLEVEDMSLLLMQERELLESTHPVDPSVIERYKRLSAQMENEKCEFDRLERQTNEICAQVKRTYDLWRPRLDDLIKNIDAKFDAAFQRMGCMGHVKINDEDPDYDKWGIEIQVSFRDNEPLQRLDQHRQSGGERSLSTIMYLMSLTELSKAPFSVVDEINQGMDRRSERLVHDQLVEITCKETASQYFLITPKLLFGLRYHPLMRVLCVNNGDWLPQGFKFGPWLDKAKLAKGGGRTISNHRA